MAIQGALLVFPPDAKVVSRRLAVARDDGYVVAYSGFEPIYRCAVDDRDGIRLAAGLFSHLKLAPDTALAEALGVSRETVRRNRYQYEHGGIDAVRTRRGGPRAPYKLTEEARVQAQQRLREGWSLRRTAQELGLSEGALRYQIRQGRLQLPPKPPRSGPSAPEAPPSPETPSTPETTSSPAQRARADQACDQGVAVKRTVERCLAANGKLVEATPAFAATAAVSGAGVLLALPALLGQGLLAVPEQVFGRLRNGFYGLRAVLLTFAFMALCACAIPSS